MIVIEKNNASFLIDFRALQTQGLWGNIMQSRQNDDPDPLNDQEAMDGIDFSMWQNSNYQSNVPSMTNYMFEEFGVQLPVRFAPQSSSIIVDFKGHMVCIVPVSIESGRASTIAHCIINLLNKG